MSKDLKKRKQVFKPYNQDNLQLPPLEELIPESHIVRVVNNVLESLNLREELESHYKGGGTSAYDPLMLLKVIIYGYSVKVYSSRKLEQGINQDIMFMWISGLQKPDHRTINNFRKEMKNYIDKIFSEVLIYLMEEKYVRIENMFIDGSKFSADANKYSHVWSKNTKRYKEKTQDKIRQLLLHIDYINDTDPEKPITALSILQEIEELKSEIARVEDKTVKKNF